MTARSAHEGGRASVRPPRTGSPTVVDTGLLIIRLAVGLFLAGHGAQKLFGWFGGHGLRGTGGFLESLGYRPGRVFAVLAGVAELGGGLLLALGLFTPLGAAAAIGMMLNATGSVHWPKVWITDGGLEYPAVLASAAAGIAFTGAGAYSLDNAFDLDLGGVGWGLAAVAVGVATGVIVLTIRRPTPEPAAGEEVRGEAADVSTSAR